MDEQWQSTEQHAPAAGWQSTEEHQSVDPRAQLGNAVIEGVKNLPRSTLNFIKAAGNLTGQPAPVKDPQTGEFQAAPIQNPLEGIHHWWEGVKQHYGSAEAAIHSWSQDPVGTAAELYMIGKPATEGARAIVESGPAASARAIAGGAAKASGEEIPKLLKGVSPFQHPLKVIPDLIEAGKNIIEGGREGLADYRYEQIPKGPSSRWSGSTVEPQPVADLSPIPGPLPSGRTPGPAPQPPAPNAPIAREPLWTGIQLDTSRVPISPAPAITGLPSGRVPGRPAFDVTSGEIVPGTSPSGHFESSAPSSLEKIKTGIADRKAARAATVDAAKQKAAAPATNKVDELLQDLRSKMEDAGMLQKGLHLGEVRKGANPARWDEGSGAPTIRSTLAKNPKALKLATQLAEELNK